MLLPQRHLGNKGPWQAELLLPGLAARSESSFWHGRARASAACGALPPPSAARAAGPWMLWTCLAHTASLLSAWLTPRCACECSCANGPNDRVLSILEAQLLRCGPDRLGPPVSGAAASVWPWLLAGLLLGAAAGASLVLLVSRAAPFSARRTVDQAAPLPAAPEASAALGPAPAAPSPAPAALPAPAARQSAVTPALRRLRQQQQLSSLTDGEPADPNLGPAGGPGPH